MRMVRSPVTVPTTPAHGPRTHQSAHGLQSCHHARYFREPGDNHALQVRGESTPHTQDRWHAAPNGEQGDDNEKTHRLSRDHHPTARGRPPEGRRDRTPAHEA